MFIPIAERVNNPNNEDQFKAVILSAFNESIVRKGNKQNSGNRIKIILTRSGCMFYTTVILHRHLAKGILGSWYLPLYMFSMTEHLDLEKMLADSIKEGDYIFSKKQYSNFTEYEIQIKEYIEI